ncbi:TRAF3-interacting protein 1 [Drosophila tropicalis]|uniref:TRAF3-interacting protein 1 n=1 Tax=Drosophila tropicalis TaxID=46794 RepID=UPI0035AB8846
MSGQELDAIIQVTQQSLGKYIKKPPLTEKLLKKPPFRFLMDVFNAFIKQTGCLDGLYTADEQLFENIGDREDKIRFLQKMIDAIKLTTKKELKVKTSKIVAGHEPELTNELLQAMASVAEQHLEWEAAVQQVVASFGGNKEKENKSKTKETKTTTKNISPNSKQEDETKKRKEKRMSPQEQKLRKATELASRVTPTEKDKAAQRKAKVSKQKTPSPDKPVAKSKLKQLSTESETKTPSPAAPPSAPQSVAAIPSPKKEPQPEPMPTKETVSPPPSVEPESRKSSAQRRSSASSGKSRRSSASQKQPEVTATPEPVHVPISMADTNNNNSHSNTEVKREGTFTRENSNDTNPPRPRTSLRPPSARPASARPGAPRRRNVEIVLQPNDQVKMSGINVKLETFGDLDDDGENLVIIEDAHAHDIETGGGGAGGQGGEMETGQPNGELDAQGRLVQQILETQKELVQQSPDSNDQRQQQQQITHQGARQSSARQVNDLRDVIQSLTKSVNPLGKLMDFIPEDIDAMQLELTMWRDTYTQSAMDLKRERNLTASATEPMKQQLVQIEASILEYQELVDESRHKILLNNERIHKMLMEQ